MEAPQLLALALLGLIAVSVLLLGLHIIALDLPKPALLVLEALSTPNASRILLYNPMLWSEEYRIAERSKWPVITLEGVLHGKQLQIRYLYNHSYAASYEGCIGPGDLIDLYRGLVESGTIIYYEPGNPCSTENLSLPLTIEAPVIVLNMSVYAGSAASLLLQLATPDTIIINETFRNTSISLLADDVVLNGVEYNVTANTYTLTIAPIYNYPVLVAIAIRDDYRVVTVYRNYTAKVWVKRYLKPPLTYTLNLTIFNASSNGCQLDVFDYIYSSFYRKGYPIAPLLVNASGCRYVKITYWYDWYWVRMKPVSVTIYNDVNGELLLVVFCVSWRTRIWYVGDFTDFFKDEERVEVWHTGTICSKSVCFIYTGGVTYCPPVYLSCYLSCTRPSTLYFVLSNVVYKVLRDAPGAWLEPDVGVVGAFSGKQLKVIGPPGSTLCLYLDGSLYDCRRVETGVAVFEIPLRRQQGRIVVVNSPVAPLPEKPLVALLGTQRAIIESWLSYGMPVIGLPLVKELVGVYGNYSGVLELKPGQYMVEVTLLGPNSRVVIGPVTITYSGIMLYGQLLAPSSPNIALLVLGETLLVHSDRVFAVRLYANTIRISYEDAIITVWRLS